MPLPLPIRPSVQLFNDIHTTGCWGNDMSSGGTLTQVEPCPRCGSQGGWFEKRVCKYIQFFEPNGEALDAGNMERVRGGDRRFCLSCTKDITSQVKAVSR